MAQSLTSEQNRRYYDINKNIDIFNSVLRELDLFLWIASRWITWFKYHRNMLTQLDPYTEYYSEENMGDLQFLTTASMLVSAQLFLKITEG